MRHCTLEKHSVTFARIPSAASRRTAIIPASIIGILTTMLSAILASSVPSFTIPSVSTATTSADTGPSTSEQISFSTSRGSRSPACFESREGLVRSEEHTSELQSRLHLVCRLLLEKKKQKTRQCHSYLANKHTTAQGHGS